MLTIIDNSSFTVACTNPYLRLTNLRSVNTLSGLIAKSIQNNSYLNTKNYRFLIKLQLLINHNYFIHLISLIDFQIFNRNKFCICTYIKSIKSKNHWKK